MASRRLVVRPRLRSCPPGATLTSIESCSAGRSLCCRRRHGGVPCGDQMTLGRPSSTLGDRPAVGRLVGELLHQPVWQQILSFSFSGERHRWPHPSVARDNTLARSKLPKCWSTRPDSDSARDRSRGREAEKTNDFAPSPCSNTRSAQKSNKPQAPGPIPSIRNDALLDEYEQGEWPPSVTRRLAALREELDPAEVAEIHATAASLPFRLLPRATRPTARNLAPRNRRKIGCDLSAAGSIGTAISDDLGARGRITNPLPGEASSICGFFGILPRGPAMGLTSKVSGRSNGMPLGEGRFARHPRLAIPAVENLVGAAMLI